MVAKPADDPDRLRARATQLRSVVRGVIDPKAAQEIEDFINELEVRADELAATDATLRGLVAHRSMPV